MRRGDIIVNPWVSRYFDGELNPNYATIYLGDNKSLDYTGKVCGWADKVYKDNPERMTPWKVIGHINLYGIAELAIRDAVFDEENKDEPNSSENPNNSTISKMEQADKDINVRSKDEPQTEREGKQMGVYIKHMKMPESCILCRLECLYRIHSSSARSEYCPLIEIADHKDEPQTEDLQDWKDRMWAEAIVTEQTEREGE